MYEPNNISCPACKKLLVCISNSSSIFLGTPDLWTLYNYWPESLRYYTERKYSSGTAKYHLNIHTWESRLRDSVETHIHMKYTWKIHMERQSPRLIMVREHSTRAHTKQTKNTGKIQPSYNYGSYRCLLQSQCRAFLFHDKGN